MAWGRRDPVRERADQAQGRLLGLRLDPAPGRPTRLSHRRSVDELLSESRSRLVRLAPRDADRAAQEGAILIDIRSDSQRAADGVIPEAVFMPRNVLEWRLDPESEHRNPELARYDRRLILLCKEGFQSSLTAATVYSFGVDATDVIGGFQAWRAAGLPVIHP